MTETTSISIDTPTDSLEIAPAKGRRRAEPVPHTPIFEEIVNDRSFRPATRLPSAETRKGKHVSDAN